MKLLSVLIPLAAFSKSCDAFVPSTPLRVPVSTGTTATTCASTTAKQVRGYGAAPPISTHNSIVRSKSLSSSTLFSQSSENGVGTATGTDTGGDASDKKSISDVFDALRSNLSDGELGSRGEVYFLLQIALVLCILIGNVPLIGDVLNIVLGPGLVLLGGSVLTIGCLELGTNLTPWPTPPKKGSLVTEGLVFNEVRHPIYAGLIYLMFGLSMWSGSAMRVLLCVVLWYLLDFKSDLEEDELVEKFGIDYIQYRERVQGKFIPSKLMEGIENTATKIGQKDKTDDE